MEVGGIDKLHLNVPWTQLYSGQVNLLVSNLNILLRLHIGNDSVDADIYGRDDLGRLARSRLIQQEELRLLDESTMHSKSWYKEVLDAFVDSFMGKIASRFTFRADK